MQAKRILLTILVFMLLFTQVSFASIDDREEYYNKPGRTSGSSSSGTIFEEIENSDIYYNPNEVEEEVYSEELTSSLGQLEEKDTVGDMINGAIRWLLVMATDALLELLNMIGLNLDKIIFGRLGAGSDPAVTSFNFADGNPFGMVASDFYVLIGLVCITFYPLILVGLLTKLPFANSKQREEIKSSILTFVIAFFSILLCPVAVEVALFVRDIMLDLIRSFSMDGASTGGLVESFRAAATGDDASTLNAFLYLGVVLMTLYFGLSYIMIALNIFACFLLFPIISTMSISPKNRKLQSDLIKDFFSMLSIPIIDATLLLVALAFIALNLPPLFALFVIGGIAPVRAYARSKVGLTSNGMMELAGVGLMLGAAKLAGGVGAGLGGSIGSMVEGIKGSSADKKESAFYSDLAQREKEDGKPGYAGSGAGGDTASANNREAFNFADRQEAYNAHFAEDIDKNRRNDWLDDPQKSKLLSNEQKAQMYASRAKQQFRKGTAKSIGIAAGSFAGAGFGASGAILGPTGMMAFAGMGMQTGATVGGGMGNLLGGIGSNRAYGEGSTVAHIVSDSAKSFGKDLAPAINPMTGLAVEQDFVTANQDAIREAIGNMRNQRRNFAAAGMDGRVKYESINKEAVMQAVKNKNIDKVLDPTDIEKRAMREIRTSPGYHNAGVQAQAQFAHNKCMEELSKRFNKPMDHPDMQLVNKKLDEHFSDWAKRHSNVGTSA